MSKTNLVIRKAQPHERQTLIALQRRASLAHEAYREALLAHPDAVDLPVEQITDGAVWVAEREDILGFAVIFPVSDELAELDGLFVVPEVWRQGIGMKLMQHVADLVRSRRLGGISVIAAPEAEPFYLAAGFQAIGSEQTRFGEAIRMYQSLIEEIP